MFSSARRSFALLALVPMISIGALFAMVVLDGRHDVTQVMRHNNANLANTVEENIRRTLDFYDRSMLGVRDEVSNPDVMALPPSVRQRVIFDKAVSVPGVSTMVVTDAGGRVILTSEPNMAIDGLSVADRQYFIHHRDTLDPGLDINGPLVSRLDNETVVVLSRRIDLPDHSFGGVVALQLKVRSLDELFNAVNLDDGSRIVLMRNDGVVLSRFPPDRAQPVQTVSDSPIFKRFQSGENNFEAKSAVDGATRFFVFKPFDRYPLTITVAQSTETAYAGWRQRTLSQALITLTLMVGCLITSWLFLRELEARQKTAHRLRGAERDLRTILDSLPAMVAYWDKHLTIRFANSRYIETFGIDKFDDGEPIGGLTVGRRLSGEHRAKFIRALQGERIEFESPVTDDQGVARHVVVDCVPDVDNGEVQGVLIQITDISERKTAEDRLFEEKERIRVTLASIAEAVISTDVEGRVTYLNPAAEKMSGYEPHEAIGRPVGEIVPLHDGDLHQPVRLSVAQALRENRIVLPSQSASLVNRRQLRFDIEDTATPVLDREGRAAGAVMVLRDVTATRAMMLRMAHLAQYDALTGLPNRVLLFDRAQQAIARATRDRLAMALLYLDLDGFKDINDSLGHDAGDAVLVQFARRMTTALRSSDTLSRQGGDEFVVLAPLVAGRAAAEVLAAKLVALAGEPFDIGGHVLRVTTSVGVAMFPQDGDTFDLLARRADAAMYSAKRGGKSRYRFYTADIGRRAERQLDEHRQPT